MARSKLLKDVVAGDEDIENILLRLKVVLSDLQNPLIIKWVNGELEGYENLESLPEYRVIQGYPVGNYIVNYRAQYSDSQVPLENLISSEEIDEITTIHITDGISTLNKVYGDTKESKYAKVIPTAFCHSISIPELQLTGMKVVAPPNIIRGIYSKVKSKLVEVIMELEKQFDNLDDLDIESQVKENPTKAKETIYQIGKIIFDDSINIGDRNKIKKSSIGNILKGR